MIKEAESDDEDYNQIKAKKWVDKQLSRCQMQMRHDHYCQDHIYIEKVCQLNDSTSAYDTSNKDRGKYHRVRMI